MVYQSDMDCISVLISVYSKDNYLFFETAMRSIWCDQILKPSEIVLVIDGPIGIDLENVVNNCQFKIGCKLKIVRLERNVGLAKALNIGLEHCSYEFIARMDADDISLPERFGMQLKFMKMHQHIDVCGMFISEIDEFGNIVKTLVKYPISHSELLSGFTTRDPFAHPVVMFRKRFFSEIGFYNEKFRKNQDTELWYRGFLNGATYENLPSIGLLFRRSQQFYSRRSSIKESFRYLVFRVFVVNRNLGYGTASNIYAILYFVSHQLPSFVVRFLYNTLR